MLIADKLVFVSLHKQGVGPVKRLLEQVLGGETRKDDAPPSELLALNRPVVGFVCHPMAWYLALWRQGCEGKGGVHRRLTDATRWQRAGPDRPGTWSAEHAKRAWYGQGDQPEAFREWLLAVLGTPAMRRVVDAAATPAQTLWLGLMTRDYLRAYVPEAQPGEPGPGSLAELQRLDVQRSLARHMIRAEHASEDMAALMREMGQALSAEQQQAVAKLTRRVSHSSDWAAFYDAASRQLLARHEPFMLARWGYDLAPPALARSPGQALPPDERAKRQAQRRAARAATASQGQQATPGDASAGADPADSAGVRLPAATLPATAKEAGSTGGLARQPALAPGVMAPEPAGTGAQAKTSAKTSATAKAKAKTKAKPKSPKPTQPPAPGQAEAAAAPQSLARSPARKAKAPAPGPKAQKPKRATEAEPVGESTSATAGAPADVAVPALLAKPAAAKRASPKPATRRAARAQAAKPDALRSETARETPTVPEAPSKGAAPKRPAAKTARAPQHKPQPSSTAEAQKPATARKGRRGEGG